MGDTLNPGQTYNLDCPEFGFSFPKNGCFLEDYKDKNRLILLHLSDTMAGLRGWFTNKLYMTTLEYRQGEWQITELRKMLYDQFIFRRSFEVVKHANGLDYWILLTNYNSDSLITFLFRSGEVTGPFYQDIDIPTGEYDWGSNSVFSPDGSKYIRVDIRSGLTIYEFDRKEGRVSNKKYYPSWIPSDQVNNLQLLELSVSASSKFLYVSSPIHLWQMDLSAEDVGATRILIDTFDGFASPFGTTFYRHQLAPDGKIYMNCTNSDNYFHIIHKPDLEGQECMFKQHDFELPTYNAFTMPYFPNYRLGPLSDTNDHSMNFEFSLYPNPVTDALYVLKPVQSKLKIYNQLSKLVMETYDWRIDVGHFGAGMYYVVVENELLNNKVLRFLKL
ncbi:MAG: T9SS type A sorting domain-containing protein [Saprospiraceae bacterium]|nr:T9SS type A sorting domain-containing protein [Saprospiraceae bacterium]